MSRVFFIKVAPLELDKFKFFPNSYQSFSTRPGRTSGITRVFNWQYLCGSFDTILFFQLQIENPAPGFSEILSFLLLNITYLNHYRWFDSPIYYLNHHLSKIIVFCFLLPYILYLWQLGGYFHKKTLQVTHNLIP